MQISSRFMGSSTRAATAAAFSLLILAISLLWAGAALATSASKSYIVVLKDGVAHPANVAHRHEDNRGAKIGHIYGVAIKGYSAELTPGELEAIEQDPSVDYVERDGVIRPASTGLQIKRVFANQNPQLAINEVNDVGVDADIAILDTGVAPHKDLNVVGSTDCFSSSGGCVNGAGGDVDGHGTAVAGAAAAIDNNFGVVGTAPGARIWSVRVLDKTGEDGLHLGAEDGVGPSHMSDAIAGINWVTARANVIEVANMSFNCWSASNACSSQALGEAIAASVNSGIVWVAAAGNGSHDVSGGTYFPAQYPAVLPDVIAVSALSDLDGVPGGLSSTKCTEIYGRNGGVDDRLAPYSNWGPAVDIAAPGDCILSTWKEGGYAIKSGTSMASALVAGAVADIAAQFNPNSRTDVEGIKSALLSAGNYNWTDLHPNVSGFGPLESDGVKEPLLDLHVTPFVPVPPSVNTTPNPAVGVGTAQLDGWFNPNGADTRYYFQYGPTTAYGATIPALPGAGLYSGTASVHAAQAVTGLGVNTTYHYRLVASNGFGTTYGADQPFTTSPYPVEASTGSAEKVDLQGATLSGSLNPRGANAYYKFEYGTTAQYGFETTSQYAGSGSGFGPVSDKVSGLVPNATYHYRIVAWNAGSTVTGIDRTFRTAPYEDSSTWSVRMPSTSSNAWEWVFYRGAEGKLTERYYNGANWQTQVIGGQVASGTTPAVVRVPSENPEDKIWVLYQNSGNKLAVASSSPGGTWTTQELTVQMAPGTSPSAVRSPTFDPSDRIWVFANGKNGHLIEAYYAGGGWGSLELATQLAPASSPAAVRAPSSDPNDRIWVFANGANGHLQNTYYAGGGWANLDLGTQMAPGTSPAVVRAPTANGFLGVFTNCASGRLGESYTVGAGWGFADLGTQMEAGTSPSAVRAPTPESQGFAAVFTHGPKGPNGEPGRLGETYYAGTAWAFAQLGAQMEAGTSPSALRAPSLESQGFAAVFTAGPKAPNGEPGRMGQTYYTSGWAFLDMGVPMFWF
jgi:hypothetical protein